MNGIDHEVRRNIIKTFHLAELKPLSDRRQHERSIRTERSWREQYSRGGSTAGKGGDANGEGGAWGGFGGGDANGEGGAWGNWGGFGGDASFDWANMDWENMDWSNMDWGDMDFGGGMFGGGQTSVVDFLIKRFEIILEALK